MAKQENLVGKKFNKLTVLEFSHKENRKRYWKCQCDCGNITYVSTNKLTSLHTKSCGCAQLEAVKRTRTTHGETKTRLYRLWSYMKKRCYCKNDAHYKDYGGRGIVVCDDWKDSYENFKNDMFESYCSHVKKFGENDTTLDRIDFNGNYSKDNCRWATRKEQSGNRRANVSIVDGEIIEETFERLASEFNLKKSAVRGRYYRLKDFGIEQTEENIINYEKVTENLKKKK